MKIALATDDGLVVSPHFGGAPVDDAARECAARPGVA